MDDSCRAGVWDGKTKIGINAGRCHAVLYWEEDRQFDIFHGVNNPMVIRRSLILAGAN